MFKKTLVALALTGLAGAASASTIITSKITYSEEGIANTKTFDLDTDTTTVSTVSSTAGSVIVAVGIDNGYAIGDQITFTFPNNVFDISTSATLAIDSVGTASTITVGTPQYSNGNSVSFTISAVGSGASAVALTGLATEFILGGIILEDDGLSDGDDVDVDYSVISSVNNGAYEEKSGTIAEVKEELSVKVTTALNGIINVSEDREEFTVADSTVEQDTLVITPAVAGYTLPATPSKVVYTVNGDFSFVDTDSDGDADLAVAITGGTSISGADFADDFQSYEFTDTTAAPAAVTVEFTAADETVIPTGSFTVDAEVAYAPDTGSATSKSFDGISAGEWKLDGTESEINFLPLDNNKFALLVSVANTGSVDGEITIDIITEGMTYSKAIDTVATAKSVTNIGPDIAAFAAEEGLTGFAHVNVVVNSPSADIETKAFYLSRSDKDRAVVK
ncbi:hypothetical protein [Paraglaciecola sp.]|uniref:hypothetical protein n=1 Tax=Paraglaciecola sp. TaxID=1920173 RepID=UPI003EF80E84